jgi:putative Mg2+ transporter-C (MgtC) family protein
VNTHVALFDSILRLALALVLGSTIGIERQWHQKIAGLRTNALVALGSCGFVVFSCMVGEGDPTRIAAQVVTGIGFLGAGVILREGTNVHGLNTAATLWCSAMVGTFTGAGLLVPSVIAAGFVIGTNICLRPLLQRVNSRAPAPTDTETHYSVALTCKNTEEAHLRSVLLHALAQSGLGLRRIDSADTADSSKVTVTAQAVAPKRADAALEQIVGRLSLEPYISAANWQVDRVIHQTEGEFGATPWPLNAGMRKELSQC